MRGAAKATTNDGPLQTELTQSQTRNADAAQAAIDRVTAVAARENQARDKALVEARA